MYNFQKKLSSRREIKQKVEPILATFLNMKINHSIRKMFLYSTTICEIKVCWFDRNTLSKFHLYVPLIQRETRRQIIVKFLNCVTRTYFDLQCHLKFTRATGGSALLLLFLAIERWACQCWILIMKRPNTYHSLHSFESLYIFKIQRNM